MDTSENTDQSGDLENGDLKYAHVNSKTISNLLYV